jgi:transcription antitermination factor NusG
MDSPAGAAWFAVFTQPRHEKKVAGHLASREVEAFLPTYRERHVWRNRQTVTLDLPLFPSYLFVKLQQRQRGVVLGVPGLLSIVGTSRSAVTIPENYIAALRMGAAQNRILPHTQPVVGDRVRIVSGWFAGFEGILAHIRSEFRVVLTIESIQKSISVEVPREEIEPVTRRADRSIADFARTQVL